MGVPREIVGAAYADLVTVQVPKPHQHIPKRIERVGGFQARRDGCRLRTGNR
ncbi:Uncharacterised protein [Mycobacteroides abscessus subsp. abscessus]|nr:Uncharacterised protein [Mycobacteroides abscessus subsp. abscessus]